MPRRFSCALVFVAFALVGVAPAQVVVGNSIVDRGGIDTATTTFVLSSQGFGAGAIGENLLSWSYFSGTNGLSLTPVLFEYTGTGADFTVRGIGASVTTSLGAQVDLPFDLVSGSSAITNANFFFGWKDGTPGTPNTGSILFDDNGGDPQVVYIGAGGPSGFVVSNTFSFDGGTLNRTYSLSGSTAAIPEPSVTALFALAAVAALGRAVWRRRTIWK